MRCPKFIGKCHIKITLKKSDKPTRIEEKIQYI
jgi:hypothetical protein